MLFSRIFFSRSFSLKAQDRAIRAEENFRHFILTGKPLDSRLTTRQIIGLRFASDEEFVELAKSAAEKGTSEEDIKKLTDLPVLGTIPSIELLNDKGKENSRYGGKYGYE